MSLENLLSYRFLIPVCVFVYRFVAECLIIPKSFFQRCMKVGPDLCYMAAILTTFNLIDSGTGLCRHISDLGNPTSFKILYAVGYAILWLICLGCYRPTERVMKQKSATNREYFVGVAGFVSSLLVGGGLLLVACELQ